MHDELTEVDIKKMQEEIDYLIKEVTPQLRVELQRARDLGDLSENDEYRTLKRELNRTYSRIRYLQNMIKTAVVIKVESEEDKIGLFDSVKLYDEESGEEKTVRIVTTLRSDPISGLISKESPFGRALLGKKVGDRVKIDVSDKYSYYVVVREIEKGTDDESLEIRRY
ncbi:MAG: GreA/GreB family elongation factor [Eubacteriales bacterium]|jgi:transcription elongation factor GreA|nr:transcription elongation factor GreA [Clostridiales bacterium]